MSMAGPGEVVFLLLCIGSVSLILGLPFAVFAILRQRREGGNLHARAARIGAIGALASGLALGAAGFFFGASVPDEHAGEAAIFLAVGGLALALPIYLVIHGLVWLFGRTKAEPVPPSS